MDLETAHPHELVAGLMRGNRRELKLGYSAANAVAAVMDLRPELDRSALMTYARGFADGLAENPELTYPSTRD